MPTFERICPTNVIAAQTGSEFVGRSAFLIVMMTGSWTMALLSWYLIEKPFLSLKYRLAPKLDSEINRPRMRDDQPMAARRAA
jgi:hypothetical protein